MTALLPGWDRLAMPAPADHPVGVPAIQSWFWERVTFEPLEDGSVRYEIRFPQGLEALARVALGLPPLLEVLAAGFPGPLLSWAAFAAIQLGISAWAWLSLRHARRALLRGLASQN